MSSKRKSQPTKIGEEIMFPTTFPKSDMESQDEVERLKMLQQECLQSSLFQQQQHQLQNLSQLNELMKPMQQQQKSMQDTLKCLKSLQLARSLEAER